jgi:putative oxidoreductase
MWPAQEPRQRQAIALLGSLIRPGALAGRATGWGLTLTRWASAIVFMSFGLGKFINHGSETASFRGYGLPVPGDFADVIGILELVGGGMLLIGLGTRVAAALLATDMVGAVGVSGILRGETVSLTLAPVLLIAMLGLVALGPGRASLDASLIRRWTTGT